MWVGEGDGGPDADWLAGGSYPVDPARLPRDSHVAYQRNPETGFVRVQRKLRTDALNEYIRHTSSAVFACPPGVRNDADRWGRALFTT